MYMKKIILIIVLLGAIGSGWFLLSPLFINTEVNEELPITSSFNEDEILKIVSLKDDDSSVEALNQVQAITDPEPQEEIVPAEPLVEVVAEEKIMDESMPESESGPVIKTLGNFQGADASHKGSGQVKIITDGDQKFLRFEDFSVTNGPDLFVTLNNGSSPSGQHVILDSLKGNKGNQNYDISDYNIDDYQSISIYCRAFSVEFATALL